VKLKVTGSRGDWRQATSAIATRQKLDLRFTAAEIQLVRDAGWNPVIRIIDPSFRLNLFNVNPESF